MGQRVGIALGTNLGNRLAYLREARDLLAELSCSGSQLLQAPVYQSAPVDCRDDAPDFFNTVVEIEFDGSPQELLEKTQSIELRLGRATVREPNAPRQIDLDLLYFGELVVDSPQLQIPHPRLTDRLFVLQPLSDIRPEHILPGDGVTIAEHLAHLETDEPLLTLVQSAW